jgi:hypothetical protein
MNFLDINDKGIEAFKTIYNPDIVKQNIEIEKQKQLEGLLEKNEEKQHKEDVFRWTKLGIIVSGIFSLAALIISILAYLKE